MRNQDVSDTKTPNTWGGSQCLHRDTITQARNVNKNTKNQAVMAQLNVRATEKAGWSEKRGNLGEYLLVFILVLSTILLVPVTLDMPETQDSQSLLAQFGSLLDTKLDKKLDPVLTKVKEIDDKITTEVSKLRSEQETLRSEHQTQFSQLETELKTRLSKVEESQKSKPEPDPPEQTPKRTLAQVVASTTPPKVGEELARAVDSEEKKMAGKRIPNRFKDKDYAARQNASPEDIERAESLWKYGYMTVGLYPCGSNSDFTRAKETLVKRGCENPSRKELETECAQEFLRKDMGIPDNIMKRLHDELEEVFMKGNTCFLKMANREAVQQIYSFSNLMGRMAEDNGVKRKLHAYIPVTLEQRFFGLKRLEYTMREARKKKGQKIHTRIFYRDGQIWAQWKLNYKDEYQDIEEPASAKIPCTEFWRKTPSPRLNNMPKGAPIHRPPLNAPVPQGRDRSDEAGKRGGRGGGRGGRGGGRGGNTGGRGGNNGGGNNGRQEIVIPAGSETNRPALQQQQPSNDGAAVVKAPENSNAVPTFAGLSNKQTRGSRSSAGVTPYSMRRKSIKSHMTQANTILKYTVTETPPPKRKADDEAKETRKQRRLSPTEQEMEEYKKLAKSMHKAGTLGLARCLEMQKMVDIGEEEKQLLKHRRKRILNGKEDYTKAQLEIDTAVLEAKKKKVRNNLAMLNDPTLETTAVDWEADVMVPSDDPEGDLETDENVFTSDEDDEELYE